MHEKVLAQGMCTTNIKCVPKLVWELYDQFSKPKRKVNVIRVKLLVCLERYFPRHVYGKCKSCTSRGMVAMINKHVCANANADADANDWVTT